MFVFEPAKEDANPPACTGGGKNIPVFDAKVDKKDFLLFNKKEKASNKENQRLLGSFGIENLAMFFIKYRVDRNSINDPFYQ